MSTGIVGSVGSGGDDTIGGTAGDDCTCKEWVSVLGEYDMLDGDDTDGLEPALLGTGNMAEAARESDGVSEVGCPVCVVAGAEGDDAVASGVAVTSKVCS